MTDTDHPPCGVRRNPQGDRLIPASLAESGVCDHAATYRVGEPRWRDTDRPRRESVPVVLACEEHVEAAKEHWRRHERLHPDREVTVRQLRLL